MERYKLKQRCYWLPLLFALLVSCNDTDIDSIEYYLDVPDLNKESLDKISSIELISVKVDSLIETSYGKRGSQS